MSYVIPPVDYTGNVAKYAWKLHDLETHTKAPPVHNVYYEAFDEDGGQKLHYLVIYHDHGEHPGAKNVDIKLTIDGETYEKTGNALDSQEFYYIYFDEIGDDMTQAVLKVTNASPLALFGIASEDSAANKGPRTGLMVTDIKLELKMTSAPGTNQTLVTHYRRSSLDAV